HYRQYNAVELAEKRRLEDVWYLLFEGELPNKEQRDRFLDEIRPLRNVPDSVKGILPAIANAGEHFVPLDALRTAVSLVAYASDFKPSLDLTREQLRANDMQLCAVI